MKGRGIRYSKALYEAAAAVNSGLEAREILQSIVKNVTRAISTSGCALLLLDSDREYLLPVAAHGLSDWYLRKGFLKADTSLPETLQGKIVTVLNAAEDPRVQYPELAKRAGIVSMLSVPMTRRGEVMGELRVYTHQPHEFSPREKDFVATMAALCAITLEKAELQEALTRASRGETQPELLPTFPEVTRPKSFAHPSEEEFARLLDFYRIEWLYEPRSFPLQWEDGRIVEMFTPDFYLPEIDLYVELTTLKQSLVTEKNRKVRRLRELYPDINIKLLNKRDYHRLLAKYGYGPLAEAKGQGIQRVLFSQNQIQKRVRELGRQISRDYKGKSPLLIGVLKGVICFMADLMRHISLPTSVDFLAISYYGGSDSGSVRITKDLDRDIAGQDVLMIEDIVDTGMTLNYILHYLSGRNPASLRVCALLDKRVRRLVNLSLDYVGFEVPDEFVVGYGLDYQGEYRNLPFIGVLTPELLEPAKRK